MPDMPKAYEPGAHEDQVYKDWEQSGFFNPDNLPGERKEPFSMVLPPPNVTGTLHMGHATMLAIQDLMVRFERMRGKKALWIPGTDHAAIATQSKVEKLLIEGGMKSPRHTLGREKFLDEVNKFAQESHDTIVNQCKKMGSSLDWSREAYTLDAERNHTVNVAFKKMYDDGLIYRGYRVINWDPLGQTTISDIEIIYKEVEATLYTFKYSKDFPIAISTTRPETKVGDMAVAVNPKDARYKQFVGMTFGNIPFAGTTISIKVVADDSVDPEFGTGALGVTPAHSLIDADIADRHGLTLKQVIGEDGRMNEVAGPLVAGKTTKEAREIVASWLKEQGLIEAEEKTIQNLATAERSGGTVEPLPKLQWFISASKEFDRDGKKATLKTLTQDAVRSGKVKITPERFEKAYFQWVDNLRDWCISRQIWFGHRVPVWYRKVGKVGEVREVGEETFVGTSAPEGDGWVQDEDTLDTWFSSGLWTFSTLGWPEKTNDLKTFHPTSVLETGYDILTFWVVRMVSMTTYLLGEVPFKEVYLHGLVRDEQGRKMSKSLGNIINPLDMIAKYGADATRLSLVIGSTAGNDVKLSEEKVAGLRNFTNKLWNISRFVLTTVGAQALGVRPEATGTTLADRWIMSRFEETVSKTVRFLENKDYSAAGETLREFTWSEFADWYLEIAKIQRTDATLLVSTDANLRFILNGIIRLWHPFMPFVTETIWKEMGEKGMLIIEPYPTSSGARDEEAEAQFETVRSVITSIRAMRADYKVEPAKEIVAVISAGAQAELLEANASLIRRLARVGELTIAADAAKPEGSMSAVGTGFTIHIPLAGLVDMAKERTRIEGEIASARKYIDGTEAKLTNKEFVGKAPEKVVAEMRAKLAEAQLKLSALEVQLKAL